MKITSKQFVDVLLKSSLDAEEQKVLVKMLPKLDKEKITELFEILVNDVSRLKKIITDFNSDIDRLVLKAKLEIN